MDKLDKIIKESINTYIEGNCAMPLYEPHGILTEMARINKKETGRCIFPYNSWEVKIWSDDHNPPHFHILRNGWNVSFIIDSGEILNIENRGTKSEDFDYMVYNVKKWLNSKCFALPKITNQENAILQWEQLHDE